MRERIYNNKGQLVSNYITLEDGQTYREVARSCRAAGFTVENSEVHLNPSNYNNGYVTLLIPSEVSLVH